MHLTDESLVGGELGELQYILPMPRFADLGWIKSGVLRDCL